MDMEVKNEEYILGGPGIGHTSDSLSQDAEKDELKEKTVWKTENLDENDVLKDLLIQVKPEINVCDQRALVIKEEPVDKNDASFIEKLKKLAHDVEDNKSQTLHRARSVKPEPVSEIISRHKQTVKLCSKQEFCFTSAPTNDGSSVGTNKNNKTFKGNKRPVVVKEGPICKNEIDSRKELSDKLLSYKQIQKGEQICEMLFSHIPVADNSMTEEIYVSNVSESNASSETENTSTSHEQDLIKSASKSEVEGCDTVRSFKQGSNVCRMSSEDDNHCFDKSPFAENPDQEKTESSTKSSQQPQISNKAVQSVHSLPEMNPRLTGLCSSALVPNSTNILVPATAEKSNHTFKINASSQSASAKSLTRKFKCSHCDKPYDDKRHLKKHLLTHGTKKFV